MNRIHTKRILLFEGLCACLFLSLFEGALEEAFLFGFYLNLAADPLHVGDIDTAYHGLYFLFQGDGIKDLFIADKRHDLRADFGLYDGKLAPPHKLGRLVNDGLRQAGIFYFHPLLVDDQHGHRLFHGVYLLLLLRLFLLSLPAKEIQGDNGGD